MRCLRFFPHTVQILYLDRIPDSAAVDTAVSGCRTLGRKKACGFVNAVLRSIIRNKNELPVPDSDDPAAGLALRYSHPKWLILNGRNPCRSLR